MTAGRAGPPIKTHKAPSSASARRRASQTAWLRAVQSSAEQHRAHGPGQVQAQVGHGGGTAKSRGEIDAASDRCRRTGAARPPSPRSTAASAVGPACHGRERRGTAKAQGRSKPCDASTVWPPRLRPPSNLAQIWPGSGGVARRGRRGARQRPPGLEVTAAPRPEGPNSRRGARLARGRRNARPGFQIGCDEARPGPAQPDGPWKDAARIFERVPSLAVQPPAVASPCRWTGAGESGRAEPSRVTGQSRAGSRRAEPSRDALGSAGAGLHLVGTVSAGRGVAGGGAYTTSRGRPRAARRRARFGSASARLRCRLGRAELAGPAGPGHGTRGAGRGEG